MPLPFELRLLLLLLPPRLPLPSASLLPLLPLPREDPASPSLLPLLPPSLPPRLPPPLPPPGAPFAKCCISSGCSCK
jgi:hypothetical protein